MSQPPVITTNKRRGIWPLQALNFFMADMQAGIGPFLGIFLLAHGWKSGLIGSVMTIGGVAGMLMTAPAGAVIDATKRKRMYVVIAALFTTLASGLILLSQNFWLVSISQVATAIAGSAIGPGVVGITLGMVRQAGFNRQNGYNQAYNHAGNVVGAALSGYLGMRFGMPAVFVLAALFGVLAVISVLLIPGDAIDDDAARGLPEKNKADGQSTSNGFEVLLKNKPLLILAATLACFHLGNGAMLPLYGMAAAANNTGNATEFVAMTIIIAQLAMIVMSLLAVRMAEKSGFWLVMLISFIALPLRGFIAAYLSNQAGLYPVQLLDGIGAGLQSVAVPGLVAHLLNGTGRVNVGQGAVMTVQGLGASLSPAIGGWMAQQIGYSSTFLILGSFAFVLFFSGYGLAACLNQPATPLRRPQRTPDSYLSVSTFMPMTLPEGPLLFAHIGDLHITKASDQNYLDYLSIVAQLEMEGTHSLDFVVLPGDNADNGLPDQYKRVATALKMLSVPVYIIPGDHDMEPGSLANFYELLSADPLPLSRLVRGVRCLFLDISGSGKGGPDFRLGESQRHWLTTQLMTARTKHERIVLFMHTYPADLTDKQETAEINQLIAGYNVVLIDMGHTHYNELANDGHVIFAATRSTGQIDEGPVGYSLISVDNGLVGWRFKPLHDAFPFVMITAPVDYRLRRDDTPAASGSTVVRAVVLGANAVQRVACQLNQGDWMPMTPSADGRSWQVMIDVPAANWLSLTVEATDASGRPGRHTIDLTIPHADELVRTKDGSDADSIGAWPENGIFGTQLGPNRNGKPTS